MIKDIHSISAYLRQAKLLKMFRGGPYMLTILITGATDGIGRLAAHDLATQGHSLLVHGRNPDKLSLLVSELKSETNNQQIFPFLADLASLEQVRKLAAEIKARFERLDRLILNAGLGIGAVAAGRKLSQDGHELLFAVNYLAPVLLTRLLLSQVPSQGDARIINVASIGQMPLDFNNLMLEHDFEPWQAYRQSKLALIMWSFDLAAELKDQGIGVNALHPGTFLDTNMVRDIHVTPLGTAQSGADTIVNLTLSEQLKKVTGEYFDCFKISQANPQAYDLQARQQLRDITRSLLKL